LLGNAIESITVEVDILDCIEVFALVLFELLAIHARSQLPSHLVNFSLVFIRAGGLVTGLGDDDAEGVDEATLGVVEVWQRDWEVKDVD